MATEETRESGEPSRVNRPGPEEQTLESVGARHQEIMKRALEGQSSAAIAEAMSMNHSTVRVIRSSPLFKKELQKRRDTQVRSILDRVEDLTLEALDVLKDYMRQKGNYERQRLAAALEILDRAGYVKIQKQITVGINAEDVIKAIARLKAGNVEVIDAEIVNGGDAGERNSKGYGAVEQSPVGDDTGRPDTDTGPDRPEDPNKAIPESLLAAICRGRVVQE